jgi:nucleoside-diphosphate-sugar epimerase
MKILITGATGFLGRNLVRHLAKFDDELLLTDLPPYLFDAAVTENWWMDRQILHCDIDQNLAAFSSHIDNVDTVVHLANRTRITPSWVDYDDYYKTNITSTQRLFEICQLKGVNRFIYISSSSVYGNNGTQEQTEDSPLKPTNPYAVSKVAAEMALTVQATRGDTELIIVRPFTMYGDFMDYGPNALVIAKFLDALDKKEPLIIHGEGNQTRDFLHSSDAVTGLKLIIDYGRKGETYNLGTGITTSINELAEIVSYKQIKSTDRPGPVTVTCANIDKLKALGFMPQVSVTEWLTSRVKEIKLRESK